MLLLAPWRRRHVIRSLAHLALDPALTIVCVTVTTVLLVATTAVSFTVVLMIPVGAALFAVTGVLGRVERHRAAALLDLNLPSPHLPLQATSLFGRLWERARSGSRWREILYLTLGHLLLTVTSTVVLAIWGGALAMLLLPAYVRQLAGGQAHFWFFVVSPGASAWIGTAAGLVGLVIIAPWFTVAGAGIDRRMVRSLLGPSKNLALTEQVRRAEARRGAAVDTAEAERRRIERDLHDGAQQRLVALAMSLGRAREQLDRDPERVRDLIGDAHEEAKAALAELRLLVRGIHPAVLADRGLDAALSSVIARSPIPVDLDVHIDVRPPATVESCAYFIVSETLTNAIRHAQASEVQVAIERAGGRLFVRVSDNGRGGADPAGGTGLAGLSARVEGLGGWLHLVSPHGGPTTVIAEIPCAS